MLHLKFDTTDLIPADVVREPVRAEIERHHPGLSGGALVCITCVNRYRAEHVCRLPAEEKGELTSLEQQVVDSLKQQELIAENTNVEFQSQLTLGKRLSDRLAQFGGSWTFILLFAAAMFVWIIINTVAVVKGHFDPYPYILLNLVLSCLAAIQAPIIMMSQNRQEAKDRLRSEHDYRVNLKAELEIRLLHAKLDQLLTHQWQHLLEIQQLQMDLMEDLAKHGLEKRPPRTSSH